MDYTDIRDNFFNIIFVGTENKYIGTTTIFALIFIYRRCEIERFDVSKNKTIYR